MATSTILGFTTYPIVRPRHGGQRRMAAFGDFYRSRGLDFIAVCTYEPTSFDAGQVGPYDIPLTFADQRKGPFPIGDLLCGDYSAQSPAAYTHYKALVERLEPAAIHVEQPFMWPLVDRLRREGVLQGVRLIYSSQNWESPLRDRIMELGGVPPSLRRAITSDIEALERDICAQADIVVAVTAGDMAQYRPLVKESTQLFLVPNGTDRRTPLPGYQDMACVKIFSGMSPFVFVGGGYPPNYLGFNELVLGEGLPPSPPVKFLAVCGGVGHGIVQSEAFRRAPSDNAERMHFFNPISDEELTALHRISRGALLPIQFGGGSNLKTAEALAMGKWVVTTSMALRGFDGFDSGTGILVADTPRLFREAMGHALSAPPPELDEAEWTRRDSLYWDRCFTDSGFSPLA